MWNEKKEEISKLANDIKYKVDSYSTMAEDKWEFMRDELNKSAEHLQNAFSFEKK